MQLQDLFSGASAGWAAYGEYEIIVDNGERYVTPSMNSKVRDYDPLRLSAEIVIDALNVGLLCVKPTRNGAPAEKAILNFCAKYGLLGFMCALPTTPDFWEYDAVYLPKNPIIRAETMNPQEYMSIFFPKAKEDLQLKKAKAMQWFLSDILPSDEPPIGIGERETYALLLKFKDMPFALRRGFQRGYAEPYEWLHNQFRDWASMFLSAVLYYEEKNETMKELHRRALSAFGGIAPHYKVVLNNDAPMLKWDFHSLLQTVQLLLSVMLTDTSHPLRACPECDKAFYAADPRAVFCSKECKNRYNVRKSRNKPNAAE